MAKKKAVRRKKVAAASVGLTPAEAKQVAAGALDALAAQVEDEGGAVLGQYSDPFGGKPLLIVALPVAQRRADAVPARSVRRARQAADGRSSRRSASSWIRSSRSATRTSYWTPNGNHRLQALKKLGVRTVVALLVPDPHVAFKILALNTEKAHNLREKSLETIRMARALAGAKTSKDEHESGFAFEFEQPSFLTLGVAYEERPRLSGGAYQPILRRVDEFLDEPMTKALKERERRGRKILKLDDAVSAAVEKLKAKGLTSPYLKPFVVARVNYTRFSKATSFDFDETLDKIIASAQKFNVDRVSQQDVAKAGGGPPPDED